MNLKSFYNFSSFWGKVLGGIFGFLIGGPTGALFGVLIGNFFDRGFSQHFNSPYLEVRSKRDLPIFEQFIKTNFKVMGYLSKAGGFVPQEAIIAAKNTMLELRLNRSQILLAQQSFNLGKDEKFNLTQELTNFKKITYRNPEFVSVFLDIQYKNVLLIGVTQARYQALDEVFQTLGFASINMQSHFYQAPPYSSSSYSRSEPPPNRPNPFQVNNIVSAYAILNLDTTASKPTVKQAYRRLISRHHPDKLIASKKTEREIKEANEK